MNPSAPPTEVITAEAHVLVPEASRVASRPGLLRVMARDRTAMVGLVIVSTLSLAAVLAPLLSSHDPNAVDVARRFLPPSSEFPLGTDHLGRDVFARLLFGARVSISSALVATAGITAVGVLLGMVAGYLGGVVDTAISRVVDIMLALPTLLTALAVTAILGPGLDNVVVGIVIAAWPSYCRIVRGAVLAEREKDYVEAARAAGASSTRILRRHLLPNVVGPVVVMTTLELGITLLAISALSFLGLGVTPPTAEWGAMLSEGRTYLARASNMMLFPGAAIFLMVLGFNLLGDGLRDVLDPRTVHGAAWAAPRRRARRRRWHDVTGGDQALSPGQGRD
ncbi:MAG TPA: nickel transporter permease [Acidimicrobiales bacterium]|nr:nickel transporter permease [Acidimicrobiales bacterium]